MKSSLFISDFRKRLERVYDACSSALDADLNGSAINCGDLFPALFSISSYLWCNDKRFKIVSNYKSPQLPYYNLLKLFSLNDVLRLSKFFSSVQLARLDEFVCSLSKEHLVFDESELPF